MDNNTCPCNESRVKNNQHILSGKNGGIPQTERGDSPLPNLPLDVKKGQGCQGAASPLGGDAKRPQRARSVRRANTTMSRDNHNDNVWRVTNNSAKDLTTPEEQLQFWGYPPPPQTLIGRLSVVVADGGWGTLLLDKSAPLHPAGERVP